MSNLFSEFGFGGDLWPFGGGGDTEWEGGGQRGQGRTLRCDVYETPNEFKCLMDAPGLNKDNLGIEVDGDVLRVSVQRSLPRCMKGDDENSVNWHRMERGPVRGSRSLRFPDSADMSTIKADLTNGLLCVCINKKPTARRRQLSIGGGVPTGAGQQQLAGESYGQGYGGGERGPSTGLSAEPEPEHLQQQQRIHIGSGGGAGMYASGGSAGEVLKGGEQLACGDVCEPGTPGTSGKLGTAAKETRREGLDEPLEERSGPQEMGTAIGAGLGERLSHVGQSIKEAVSGGGGHGAARVMHATEPRVLEKYGEPYSGKGADI